MLDSFYGEKQKPKEHDGMEGPDNWALADNTRLEQDFLYSARQPLPNVVGAHPVGRTLKNQLNLPTQIPKEQARAQEDQYR